MAACKVGKVDRKVQNLARSLANVAISLRDLDRKVRNLERKVLDLARSLANLARRVRDPVDKVANAARKVVNLDPRTSRFRARPIARRDVANRPAMDDGRPATANSCCW
jgi:hypothetical protein